MEDLRRGDVEGREREIAYSRSVKAGKRIYYLDVKRSHNDDLYLSLTESKKKVSGDPENPDVSYEKHKIFLYKEDLSKFTEALIDVIKFMQDYDVSDKTEDSKDDSLTDALNSAVTTEDSEPAIKLNLEDFE
ncbi:MAG: DUF3276 family protein [Bacteroidales bacterium]|nr:PUR family DNA/RNA-binding protein [Bacteroidales bacterium]